ncbi:MAG: peptidylprolyl isomerase [Planctomycetaceae bacterium]|nr:peptidylprolyl isomerase [Planctomycetaceae bacterium]
MRIEKNAVVDIDYTLTDNDGNVLDTSEGRDPMSYLHGSGQIIPGLERELEGQEVGADLKVVVAPADGYGERNESLLQTVTRDQFEGVEDLAVGMQFRVDSNAGPMVITVIKIEDTDITIDGNHPLAGVNLNFAVTVRNIREATPEEIEQGQAQGPEGQEQ